MDFDSELSEAHRNFLLHGGVAEQSVCAFNAVLFLRQTFNAAANCSDRALAVGEQTLQGCRQRVQKMFVERFWGDNFEKIGEHGLNVHGGLIGV